MKISDYFPKAQSPQNRTGTQRVDNLTSSIARLNISRTRPLNHRQTPNGLVRDVPRNMHGSALIQPSRGMAEKLEQIRENPFVLQCFALEDRENEEIVLLAAKINIDALEHAGPGLKSSGEFFVKVVAQQKEKLTKSRYNPPEFEKLVIVGCNGDETSCFEEVKIRSGFEYAFQDLKSNTELVRKLADIYGIVLRDAAPFLQDDEETVRIAAMSDPAAYAFASERLKDYKEYVLKLLKEGDDDEVIDLIFPFLSKSLRGDAEVVFATYLSTADARPELYLSDEAKDCEEFYLRLCEITNDESTLFDSMSSRLRSIPDFMLKIVKDYPENILLADPSLLENTTFMLNAVLLEVDVLEHVDPSLLNNPRFMLNAIRLKPKSTKYIGQELMKDRKFRAEVEKILKSKEARGSSTTKSKKLPPLHKTFR